MMRARLVGVILSLGALPSIAHEVMPTYGYATYPSYLYENHNRVHAGPVIIPIAPYYSGGFGYPFIANSGFYPFGYPTGYYWPFVYGSGGN